MMNTKKADLAPAQAGRPNETAETRALRLATGARLLARSPTQDTAPTKASMKLQSPPLTGYDCPCARKGLTTHAPDCLYYSKPDVAPYQTGQHTPGPWQYWKPGAAGYTFTIGQNPKEPLAKTLGWMNEELNEANAQLIAAAPDLLEALKALANCPDYRNINTHQMDQARIAIAKAERK